MNRLIEMLGEPSTWRGLLSLLTGFGVVLAPEQAEAIIAAGLSLMGLINVFRREVKHEKVADNTPAG